MAFPLSALPEDGREGCQGDLSSAEQGETFPGLKGRKASTQGTQGACSCAQSKDEEQARLLAANAGPCEATWAPFLYCCCEHFLSVHTSVAELLARILRASHRGLWSNP